MIRRGGTASTNEGNSGGPSSPSAGGNHGTFSGSAGGRALVLVLLSVVVLGSFLLPSRLIESGNNSTPNHHDGFPTKSPTAHIRKKIPAASVPSAQDEIDKAANSHPTPVPPSTAATASGDDKKGEGSSASLSMNGVVKRGRGERKSTWVNGSPIGDNEAFLTFNDLYSWYGLTNMMLCYAAAMRYAVEGNRSVIFPENMMANFYELFDPEKTMKEISSVHLAGTTTTPQVKIRRKSEVPSSLLPTTSMNKKNLFLPQRTAYRQTDVKDALIQLAVIHHRSKKYRFVRHHNFFMRYPWSSKTAPYDECFYLSSLVLADPVTNFFKELLRVMKAKSVYGKKNNDFDDEQQKENVVTSGGFEVTKYIAVHLRLEMDSSLIRPKQQPMPSGYQLKEFFANVIVPKMKQLGANAVYICTGYIDKSFLPALEAVEKEHGVKVLHFGRVAPLMAEDIVAALPSAIGEQRDSDKTGKGIRQTQDHYRSGVEYLVLKHSAFAIMPIYSSFKFAVYASKCSLKAQAARNVLLDGSKAPTSSTVMATYNIDAKANFNSVVEVGCQRKSLGWCGDPSWT